MKKCVLNVSILWALLLSFWTNPSVAAEPEYTVIENQAKLPLLTPGLSERKVLKLRLANGLEAIIVSDPKADMSGAALAVNAGSWEDPDAYPGIAHFNEHMLFLGTKKYPVESEYQRFVADHGGSANAYTTHAMTCFMFDINNPDFVEALDRFSHFFKDPLFNPSGVSRELHAIDSEYNIYVENDDFRSLYVDKALANPKHPYHRFHIGNSETLSKVSHETLTKWYEDHYSANLMRLFVFSPLPLDKLRDIVVADFKDVPNKNLKPFTTNEPLYTPGTPPTMVYIEPIKNERSLTLLWALPRQFSDMLESQPGSLACYVLGHEGKDSLLAELKREKLAEKLECGDMRLSNDTVQFYLDIELTDDGVKQVNTVIERFYQTIAGLKAQGIPKYLFDEMQRMATINYEYQSREDVFENMMKQCGRIMWENLATYPEHTLIIQKYDPQALKALLNELTPQKAHLFLMAPSYLTGIQHYDHHEQWMGAEYSVKRIEPDLLKKWENASSNPNIGLPPINKLIPQHLTLLNKAASLPANAPIFPHPETIEDDDAGHIYFAQDTRYNVPQISWIFDIKTPQVEMGNAQKAVLADLYVRSVTEALNIYSYPALLAGLDYEITPSKFGIRIKVAGYSENASLLFQNILQQLKEVNITEQQFNIYKESLLNDYLDFGKKRPIEQASEFLRSILYKKYTTDKQKAAAIKKVTFSQFNDYATQLFKRTYIEGMLYGNMEKSDAEAVVKKLKTALNSTPAPKEKSKRPEVIILPKDRGPFYWELTTKAQGNAVILAIENPDYSLKTRAAQQVLMQALEQPFFATLRTKQQTGYIVVSDDKEIEKKLFNLFAVQSNTHDVRDLLARFELFIEGYLQEMSLDLSEERFNTIKKSLIEVLAQPPKDMNEMTSFLFQFAFEYDGDFDWMAKRIQAVKDLTYLELLEVAHSFLGRQNKRRFAVLLKGVQPEEDEFNYVPIGNPAALRKLSTYTND